MVAEKLPVNVFVSLGGGEDLNVNLCIPHIRLASINLIPPYRKQRHVLIHGIVSFLLDLRLCFSGRINVGLLRFRSVFAFRSNDFKDVVRHLHKSNMFERRCN